VALADSNGTVPDDKFYIIGVTEHLYLPLEVGCALTSASEAKFEIEAKISLRLEAKKNLILHDSL
jgi:hypothetical protein